MLPRLVALPVAHTVAVYWAAVGALHVEHVASVVALPRAEVYCVATQAVLSTQTVAGLASWSHVLALHGTEGAVLPAQ